MAHSQAVPPATGPAGLRPESTTTSPKQATGSATGWYLASYTHQVLATNNRPRLDLNGLWAFRADPGGQGMQVGYWVAEGSGSWSQMRVPGHWQAEGLDYQGRAWYRRRFGPYRAGAGRRLFLVFEGVDYWARVWLNGVFLGAHEGGYFGFEFDVTEVVRADRDNLLAVEVDCPMNAYPEAKRMVKGAISHWDCIPVRQGPLPGFTDSPWYPHPVLNPAGIWGAVYLEERPVVHVRSVNVDTGLVEGGSIAEVTVRVRVRNAGDKVRQMALRLRIAPANFEGADVVEAEREVAVGPGEDEVTLTVLLSQPRLWWSWDQGFPHLYRLDVWLCEGVAACTGRIHPAQRTAAMDGSGVIDAVTTRFGVREVRRGPNWELYLNGRRFFARGTNYLSRLFMSTASPELYDRHLSMVRELGMNLVRVFAHVELPYFYDRCDELGILVYQDLPLQWGYEQSPEVVASALAMAEQMVTALRNHPCVIIWCCHSEPRLPDWLGLTRTLFRRMAELDPSRILVKASVFAPVDGLTNEQEDAEAFEAYHRTALTVSWVGWYWDRVEDIEKYNPRFISEMGAQAVPDVQSLQQMLPEGALWPPDSEAWKRLGFQLDVYRQNLGEPPDNLETLVARSQEYQARLLKSHVEAFRRKKYRPVNAVVQFTLTDCAPVISWSVVDFFGRPKAGYHVLRTVMQPLLVSIQVRSESRVQGAPVDVNIWVINDYPHGFDGAVLLWEVLGPDGARLDSGRRKLDVPADSALEGAARFTLRFARPGRHVIRATLYAAGGGRCLAENESHVDVRAE